MDLTPGKENRAAQKPNVLPFAAKISAASRWLPVLVGVGISTATLFVWQALVTQERAQLSR